MEPPPRVVTETEFIKPTKPIVPTLDVLEMQDVEFVIITPENIDEVMADIKSDNKVIFGVTDEGYKNIATNLASLRAYIQQQNNVIVIYESQYDG